MFLLILLLYVMSYFYIPSAKDAALSKPLQGYTLSRSSPPQNNAWIGSAITAGASLLGGLFGNKSQNKNIDKQIQAQREENQKNRDYNLMLAQQQNAWNVEQWERENAYNDPSAQMERMRKAGINPDMMVSNGLQNLSASSPAMTAGAASTAQDMSILGQRPTLGQAIQTALRDSMIGAQIDNIKADTRQKNANAGITEIEERTMKAIESIRGTTLDAAEIPKDWSNNPYIASKLATYEKALDDAKIAAHDANIRGYDEFIRKIEKEFKRDEVQKQLDILSNQLDISRNEAEYLVKTLEARINGVTFETQVKEYEAILNSPELIEKFPEGIKPLVSLLNLIFRGH